VEQFDISKVQLTLNWGQHQNFWCYWDIKTIKSLFGEKIK